MKQSVIDSNQPVNRLLAALPDDVYQRLFVDLEQVELIEHQILSYPGDSYDYAYFPCSMMISHVAIMENGSTAEIGVIGNEGMVGLPIILNTDYIINSCLIVQVRGTCWRIAAKQLQKEYVRYEALFNLLQHYLQARFIQVGQTAACNSYHKIEQRFARWLLMVYDSIQRDEFYLTQEFISQMLGVRRGGVTAVAAKFQKAGIIQYNRGLIKINSLEKLEAISCECYELVRNEFERIIRIV